MLLFSKLLICFGFTCVCSITCVCLCARACVCVCVLTGDLQANGILYFWSGGKTGNIKWVCSIPLGTSTLFLCPGNFITLNAERCHGFLPIKFCSTKALCVLNSEWVPINIQMLFGFWVGTWSKCRFLAVFILISFCVFTNIYYWI